MKPTAERQQGASFDLHALITALFSEVDEVRRESAL
jgi:hypothetical protein